MSKIILGADILFADTMKAEVKMLSSPVTEIAKKWRAILGEFFATMMLVFFGCMACVANEGTPAMIVLFASFGFGLIVMFLVIIFGHISGAMMNPFIAISAVIWNKISVQLAIAYIVAECAGAIAGYGFLILLAPVDVVGGSMCVAKPHNVTQLQALGIEMFLTGALSLVNCALLDPVNAKHTDSVAMKFGFTITALAMIGASTTGASMNPARSLGPAVWTNDWDSHWVYWVGPLVGGILPAIFYKWVWLKPKEDQKMPS